MAKDKETDPNLELEVERLRLQNENLKLQLEIENKRNPPSPDSIIEEQLERQRECQRQALDDLAAGPHKFHVHLPGNFPTIRPRHEPHLVVGASQAGKAGAIEAAERYNAYMGIVSTPGRHQITEAGGVVVELPATVSAVDFDCGDNLG
ncbi:MAG TPA: hypothetical protein VG826_31055 [Pirellulales bacterium]|nr:hypothetical protein [Pirellulales bacterium]